MDEESARQFRVRTNKGGLALFGTFVDFKDSTGPLVVTRYKMFPSISVMGAPAPGFSSGDAIDLVEELAEKELPRGMGYEWTELTYLQIQAGNTAMVVFAIAVVLVFLVLAAQYESWKLPLAVILVVPMCLLCSVIGVQIASLDLNIFVQIGFVVLV